MTTAVPAFRFDPIRHEYFLGEKRLPSISELMDRGGLYRAKDYFTTAHRIRGQEVHTLAMDLDFGTLNLMRCDSQFVGYVKAYDYVLSQIQRPSWSEIEVFDFHEALGFAGRKDRVGRVFERHSVAELKSGVKLSAVPYRFHGGHEVRVHPHGVQLALQALLDEQRSKVPHKMIQRLGIYLKPSGKGSMFEYEDPLDFDVAGDLLRRFGNP